MAWLMIVFLFGLSAIGTGDAVSCPAGWDEHQNECYLFVYTYITWNDALSACQAEGADLASIHDLATHNFIYENSYEAPWIGLFQPTIDSAWEWTDGTPVDFTSWDAGEPNDVGVEDCGQMSSWGDWNDAQCNIAVDYVCKLTVVASGSHTCEVKGVVHQPGEMDWDVEVGASGSGRWENCDCPLTLPDYMRNWRRNTYCRGLCFDNLGGRHYEGETYNTTNDESFQYSCTCGDHGGRNCDMVIGGHACTVYGEETHFPGDVWRRQATGSNGEVGTQECVCPDTWHSTRNTHYGVHRYCKGVCYEDNSVIYYDSDSPYQRADANGDMMDCQCFNAGVEFCNPSPNV